MSSRSSTRMSSRRGSSAKPPKATNCSSCSKPNKTLKTLPCDHSYCPACLKKCIASKEGSKSGRSSASSAKKPAEKVECIICKEEAEKAPVDLGHGECGPCTFEGKTTPASGFCVECGELLCTTCSGEHNKFKTIRRHTILTGDQIPKDTGAMSRISLLMVCPEHNDKDLEYFCVEHNEMGCSVCVNIGHRRCDRVMFIKDVAEEPTDKRLCAEAVSDLRSIRKNFEDITHDTGDIIESLEKQRDDIRKRREELRTRIIELLDKLDTSCELEMEQAIQHTSNMFGRSSTGGSNSMTSEIDKSIEMLDAALSHASDRQLFVAVKRSATEREKYVNALNTAMGNIHDVKMQFKPEQTLERLIRSMEIFHSHTIQMSNVRGNTSKINYERQASNPGMGISASQPNLRSSLGESISYVPRTDVHLEEEELGPARVSKFETPRLGQTDPRFRPLRRANTVSDMNGYQPSMTESYHPVAPRSLPQTPQSREYAMSNYSYPQTPQQGMLPRLTRADTYQGNMTNRFTMNGDYPAISQRSVRSEPANILGMHRATTTYKELLPDTPRITGASSLVGPGLNQPSRSDVLTFEKGGVQKALSMSGTDLQKMVRRESTSSLLSPRQANAITLPEHEFSKVTRQDILSQASPIKNRSELSATVTPLRERKALLAGQFNVRLLSDEYVCGLKGSAFLPDGRIALADYDNHNVKLFDSRIYRGTHLRLSSGPWDIAVTGHKEIAVSLPFESKIQFVSVGDVMKKTRCIKMEMDCYGLVCRNQELIVVCNDYLVGPAVQIMTMTGRIKLKIDTDKTGRRILTDPYYLAVSPDNKTLYVSDKDRIVCIDRLGNVIAVYQDTALRNARGVDMDTDGNLYVCGYMSNNVYQVTNHGIDFRCLVSKDQVWDPWSVTFNDANCTLLVTCDGSDTVKIYSLH